MTLIWLFLASPPTSPVPTSVDSRSPAQLPIPDSSKRDSKTSSDEDQQTSNVTRRMATKIPTRKSYLLYIK
jgi:hypothetical protein